MPDLTLHLAVEHHILPEFGKSLCLHITVTAANAKAPNALLAH